MTLTTAYIMGFAHGAVVCSACALFGQWLGRRASRPPTPTPQKDGGNDGA